MDTSENKGIVLNRMDGSGKYLHSNLGHEVINFFKADNDNHYIYLNATGNFEKKHSNKIGHMLFVKYYDKDIVEIIGMATGLEDFPGANSRLKRNKKYNEVDEKILNLQVKQIKKDVITYEGKSILDIFKDAEQQSIYITYTAKKVYRTKNNTDRLFICFNSEDRKLTEENVVYLSGHNQSKTSLKQYIYPSEKNNDYTALTELIENKNLWEEVEKVNLDQNKTSQHNISLFDICDIQNNENCFSSALAYFISQPQYYELWQKFFYNYYQIDLKKNFTVAREQPAKIEDDNWDHKKKPSGGRIDLLISDDENVIVIENKIKSDINTIATDGDDSTQLNRYVNYVEWLVQTKYKHKPTPNCLFTILTPSYNLPKISDPAMKAKYKIITYAVLYDFLKGHLFSFYNDVNFVAFFEAMERHTHKNVNDYLYYEMQDKFYRRIRK